ncbi:zinc-binding dehydrogenase [Nonomuraea sp. NPDC004186]
MMPNGVTLNIAPGHEVLDHTTTDVVDTVTQPVDLLLNLAPIEPPQLADQAALVRSGGAVVNTTVWTQAPSDEGRQVRGLNVFVRSDAKQLAGLVAAIDRGELHIDISRRIQLEDLPGKSPPVPCPARSSSLRRPPLDLNTTAPRSRRAGMARTTPTPARPCCSSTAAAPLTSRRPAVPTWGEGRCPFQAYLVCPLSTPQPVDVRHGSAWPSHGGYQATADSFLEHR